MAKEIRVDGKLKLSLRMKRYIQAAKMAHEWQEKLSKAQRYYKKWTKKLKYYRSIFEENPN